MVTPTAVAAKPARTRLESELIISRKTREETKTALGRLQKVWRARTEEMYPIAPFVDSKVFYELVVIKFINSARVSGFCLKAPSIVDVIVELSGL